MKTEYFYTWPHFWLWLDDATIDQRTRGLLLLKLTELGRFRFGNDGVRIDWTCKEPANA